MPMNPPPMIATIHPGASLPETAIASSSVRK